MRTSPLSSAATPRAWVVAGILLFAVSCSGSAPPNKIDGDDGPGDTDDDSRPSTAKDAGAGKKTDAGKPPSSAGGGTKPEDDKPRPTPNTEIVTEPLAIDDCGDGNAAGVSAADATKLKAGGGSAGGMKWLYPYDGTVFPRGMIAPELMWQGGTGDVAYVHIKSKIFEYAGCVKPTAAGRIALDQEVWDKAGQRSQGKQDIYTLEVSVLSQGKVTGPVSSTFQIAQAAIKGSIYYNTYSSKLVGAGGADPTGGLGGLFPIPGGFGGGGSFEGGDGRRREAVQRVLGDRSHSRGQAPRRGN
ncbi:MAG: hypothetical protein RLZZ450_3115 [Pseudomonadota bacterium]|jgi:hypothetical protein